MYDVVVVVVALVVGLCSGHSFISWPTARGGQQVLQHKVGLLPGNVQELALKDLKTRRAAVRQLLRKSIVDFRRSWRTAAQHVPDCDWLVVNPHASPNSIY